MPKEKPLLDMKGLVAMLDEFGSASLDEAETQGMLRLMNVLEARAVELAPVKEGNLEASTVVRVEKRGNQVRGTLRFGVPYAAVVHEMPEHARGERTLRKPGNEYGPAGPQYLRRPLRGFQRRMTQDLGKFLQEIWAKKARSRG